MKFKLFFFSFFLIAGFVSAQVVTVTPAFPTENDSITIVFNAKEATNKNLVGYTGDVYTHTGVTTTARWQHVIGTWGNNSTQPKLTRIGTDLYQLVIGKPHVFYNASSSEKITELCFVFRSSDASKQTEDIFVAVYDKGLNLVISSPAQYPVFPKLNDTVVVKATASNATRISLFENNTFVTEVSGTSLTYNLIAKQYGKRRVRLVAQDQSGTTKADSFYYVVNPPLSLKDVPAGTVDGINYNSPTSVTLSLYAPYKKFAYVIGDFNNWEADSAYFMNISPDSTHYWITLNNLTPQLEYAFQYYVDGQIKIADPYTHKVLDPANDKYIPASVYPNLKQYPFGKTDNIVSVFQTDQAQFPWQISKFNRPAKNNLVIYELLVRDFIATHDYTTLKDTLNYLKQLGVNAIELMPVTEFEGNESWGYNIDFALALDKYYGTPDDFKKFIDECHKNGIAVIMDMVLNHAFGSSPMVRLYWDSQNNQPAANSPWFNQVARHPYNVGYDFNHESLATKYYVDRVTSYWIKEFNIDGYRFDLSKGFTQRISSNDAQFAAYDQSRIDILERMAGKIWSVDTSAYVILEHFAEDREEIALSNYGMMLWGNLNYSYNEATMGYAGSSDFSRVSYKARGWQKPYLVGYMESHDEERLMYKNIQFGNSYESYNIKDTAQALNRVKLASAFFFTVPGPKMIWQFGELGYDYSIDFNGRLGNKPIRWDYVKQPKREKLYKVMQALIKLKTGYEAFKSADFSLVATGAFKTLTISHPTMNVCITGNFGIAPYTVAVNFQNTGIWYDYFTGAEFNVTGTQMQIPLQAGEFHIYTTVKLPTPETDILNDVQKTNAAGIKTFELSQNYPNPFNPTTMISYQVAKPVMVRLKIYDLLGREIKTLVEQEQASGQYRVEWKGDNNAGVKVSGGMYLYRIEAGSFVDVRKMMYVK